MSVRALGKSGLIFVSEGKEKVYKLMKHKKVEVKEKEDGSGVRDLLDELIYKVDNIKIGSRNGNINLYGENDLSPVEVDIKRNLSNYSADKKKIVVDEIIEGKVNNKLDKLRALRKK
tara:strand:+ start:1969 stop:2319 length:351 start_codon:yes stop_codon:yes gene_type:complete